MELTGQQFQELSQALRHAFIPQRLTELLRYKLDRDLVDISLATDYQHVTFELIRTAVAEGWVANLVVAAREANPGNPKLLAFAEQLGLASTDLPTEGIERLIRETNAFLDVESWRARLGRIEAQVCRIEIRSGNGTIYGTGFLI